MLADLVKRHFLQNLLTLLLLLPLPLSINQQTKKPNHKKQHLFTFSE